MATAATLSGGGALYLSDRAKELMFVESERNWRIVDVASPGNGRIASDKFLVGVGGSYARSCVLPAMPVNALTGNNRGSYPSLFYFADAYTVYYEIPSTQRILNYSLAPIPVLSFATPTSASVQVGATFTKVATSSISGEGSGAISYTSSVPSIATVNSATGLVTGVAAGTVTITATQAASRDARTNDTASKTYALTVTAVVPSVATPTSASVGVTSATLGGTVTATGAATLSAYGVVYAKTSDNSNPTIGGTGVTNVVAGTTATGAFTLSATGLSPGITYSYRAYATNSVGTAYSSAGTFTTMLPTPTLSFAAGSSASVAVGATFANAATSSLSGSGYGAISYSSASPTIATVNAAGVVAGVAVGTVTITATQAAAVGFNNQASETYTLTVIPSAPSVGSPTSASIRAIRATLGGAVTATGGVNVTARGVVYARTADNANPQIGGANVTNVLAESAGMGAFTVSAAVLSQETAYSYAAYATNSVGTTYTTVGAFTTGVDFTYTDNGTLVTITGYTGDGGAVTIRGTIGGHLVAGIAQGAFSGCVNLKNVTIPDSVTRIGQGAFADCSGLTSATIGAGVAAIEADAFARCVSLPSVLIPGAATLGANAFPEGTTVRRYYTDAQMATRDSAQYAAGQTAGRADVTTSPNSYSLYTVGQIQELSVGSLLLTRNTDGSFTLNYDLEQSTDLVNWTRFQSNAVPLSGLPANKAFVRIRAK